MKHIVGLVVIVSLLFASLEFLPNATAQFGEFGDDFFGPHEDDAPEGLTITQERFDDAVSAGNTFGLQLYQRVAARSKNDKNIFFSPYRHYVADGDALPRLAQ